VRDPDDDGVVSDRSDPRHPDKDVKSVVSRKSFACTAATAIPFALPCLWLTRRDGVAIYAGQSFECQKTADVSRWWSPIFQTIRPDA